MKVSAALTPTAHEFACHTAACRPPQSGGTGGSSSTGGSKKRTPRYGLTPAEKSRKHFGPAGNKRKAPLTDKQVREGKGKAESERQRVRAIDKNGKPLSYTVMATPAQIRAMKARQAARTNRNKKEWAKAA